MNKQQRAKAAAERAEKRSRRLNVYVCADLGGKREKPPCGRRLISIDVDKGVTPFMMGCACGGFAYSSMYRVSDDDKVLPADIEWYKPTPAEAAKFTPGMRAHFSGGGLAFRVVSPRAEYLRGHEGLEA